MQCSELIGWSCSGSMLQALVLDRAGLASLITCWCLNVVRLSWHSSWQLSLLDHLLLTGPSHWCFLSSLALASRNIDVCWCGKESPYKDSWQVLCSKDRCNLVAGNLPCVALPSMLPRSVWFCLSYTSVVLSRLQQWQCQHLSWHDFNLPGPDWAALQSVGWHLKLINHLIHDVLSDAATLKDFKWEWRCLCHDTWELSE